MDNGVFYVAIVLIVLAIIIFLSNNSSPKKEGFGLEKRPFNFGNEYYNVNPFDEMDYITPAFYRY
jgi:hypothetical protein